jgi:putative tryptophan/tyrosine transport system substrate-binding protein
MQFGQLKRRAFITLLGGAAAWPLALRAQQSVIPAVGFLHGATLEAYVPMVAAFRKSLSEAGYSEGQSVTIEFRWAEGRLERLPELAADLVRRQVSVIFAGGGAEPALVAKAATSKIPIVFANGVDPVEVGLVASLNRPGGNITGVTFLINTLGPKELEALHDLRPQATVIAALINPNLATTASQSKDAEMAARALGLQVHVLNASTEREIETVFESLPKVQAGGLVIGANAFFFSRRDQLVGLATRYSVPTVYPWREAVMAGGLMSYGANVTDAYRLAGNYTSRILKGEKPADLPVQQSTNTELVINLKTAKSLGLTFPITLLGRANEVIE